MKKKKLKSRPKANNIKNTPNPNNQNRPNPNNQNRPNPNNKNRPNPNNQNTPNPNNQNRPNPNNQNRPNPNNKNRPNPNNQNRPNPNNQNRPNPNNQNRPNPNNSVKKKAKLKKPTKKIRITKKLSELTPKEREAYLKRKQRKLEKQIKKVDKNKYPGSKTNNKRNPKTSNSNNQRPNQRPNRKRKSKPKIKLRDSAAYNPKKDPYNPYYQNDGMVIANGKNKVRKKRYKKNYILYYILLSIIASITLYSLSITIWFEIENITVTGDSNISYEEIIELSEIELYENLVKLSRKSTSKKVADSHITIDSVEIHKKYPDTVEIEVIMAKPKALIYYDRLYYTLSESNRIIGYATRNYFDEENLVSFIMDDLEGIDLGYYLEDFNENILEEIDRLLVAIEENNFDTINYVDVTNISDIRFYASDLYEIKAGGFSEISYKLHCAKSIIDFQLEDDTQQGIIDVSVDNGIYYFRPAVDIRPNITN